MFDAEDFMFLIVINQNSNVRTFDAEFSTKFGAKFGTEFRVEFGIEFGTEFGAEKRFVIRVLLPRLRICSNTFQFDSAFFGIHPNASESV